MNSHTQTINEDELEFRTMFLTLWNGKIYIFIITVFSLFFASMYIRTAEREYTVEYKLKPVFENEQKSGISVLGLDRLAEFTGAQLPSKSASDFKIFQELISSVQVSEVIFKNKKLVKKIYNKEWNSSQNSFSEPPKSKLRAYVDTLGKILTGNKEVIYIAPNARRLSIYFSENISVIEDKQTGFLTLKAETSKPELLSLLISESIEITDQIMRQRYIDFSKEPLAFYKEKLRTARSREHREALALLIGNEEEKLMLASKGKYFIAEPYIGPTISLYPTAPNPMPILLLSVILGLLSGCGVIISHRVIVRDKNE